MREFTLSEQHHRGVAVVAVSGELDLATAPQFEDYFAHLAATGHHCLVLDTARLSFCDAAGIRVMISARMRADARGGWLRLAAPSPRLRWLLEILALEICLPAFETVVHAIADTGIPTWTEAAGTPSAGLLAAGA